MGSPRSRSRHASLGNIKARSPLVESRHRCATLLHTPGLNPTASQILLSPSPSGLSREWSRSDRFEDTASNYSPTLSSIAPSPGSRIRSMVHARAQLKSAPRLCGTAFALVESMFDAIATTKQKSEVNMNPKQDKLHKVSENSKNVLIREQSLDGDDFYAIPLPNLVSILQSVATKHLVSDQLSLKDKMFLTHLLCETYKLNHDVFFGGLLASITAANAAVVNMPQQSDKDHWSCDNVLTLILATIKA